MRPAPTGWSRARQTAKMGPMMPAAPLTSSLTPPGPDAPLGPAPTASRAAPQWRWAALNLLPSALAVALGGPAALAGSPGVDGLPWLPYATLVGLIWALPNVVLAGLWWRVPGAARTGSWILAAAQLLGLFVFSPAALICGLCAGLPLLLSTPPGPGPSANRAQRGAPHVPGARYGQGGCPPEEPEDDDDDNAPNPDAPWLWKGPSKRARLWAAVTSLLPLGFGAATVIATLLGGQEGADPQAATAELLGTMLAAGLWGLPGAIAAALWLWAPDKARKGAWIGGGLNALYLVWAPGIALINAVCILLPLIWTRGPSDQQILQAALDHAEAKKAERLARDTPDHP